MSSKKSSKKLPMGVVFIGLFHLLSACGYVVTLFTTFPGDFDDDGGLRLALILVAGTFALFHTAVGVGLIKGKRLALLGAIALGSLNAIPAFVGLLVSIPLGVFPEFAAWLLPGLIVHGGVLGYLALSKSVRETFR